MRKQDVCQRWKARREFWRPASECINPRVYEVARIEETLAKNFVQTHHYSGSYVAAKVRVGLFRKNRLVGTAVFSQPISNKVFDVFQGAPAVELGRFVLLDPEPANSETWFLARCFRILRMTGYEGVVSFSDPTPRCSREGVVVHPGHVGTIYQASCAIYAGRSTPRTLKLLGDGRVLNDRSIQKIRSFEKGWRPAAAQLVAEGAEPLTEDMDSRAWLRKWLPRLTRPLRHQGNHRYLWGFSRSLRRSLPVSLAYPKRSEFGIIVPLN